MKYQDIIFFIVIVLLIFRNKHKISLASGIICLFLAIPLFTKWVFFTAERLTWYGAGFILLSIIQIIFQKDKYEKENK